MTEREDYLNSLADDYNADRDAVYALADLLGAGEDYDGLIDALEDYTDMEGFY